MAAGGSTQGSLLVFNGGVLGLTAASGDFNRSVGTTQFLNNVRWQGSGGFAAYGGNRIVNLGGAGATLSWTAGGFVPNGQSLILGLASADSTIDFANGIDFGTANRTVLVNDGTAAIDAILSGTLSSTSTGGGLVKSGAGTLVLTGANTYTGATTISGGALQVGNGGTTGSLGTGNVTDNAQLAVNRSDAYTIGQVVSGSGSVRQIGAGTTTLTANNTYTGGTVVSSGTLQIGNGGATGAAGAGAITNNSIVSINRNNALTVASVIGGAGVLRQDGVGTTTLSGVNTFTGAVELNAGVLAVSNLQDGGVSSNLGASSNAAANLSFDGGTLRYTGAARSTDRNFLIEDGGATIDGSGTGVLTWNGAPSYRRRGPGPQPDADGRRQRQHIRRRAERQRRRRALPRQVRNGSMDPFGQQHLLRRDDDHRRNPAGRQRRHERHARQRRGHEQRDTDLPALRCPHRFQYDHG